MTNEAILDTMSLAEALTVRHKDKQFTEDFTQFALEKRLGGRKASVGELLIDFMRSEFGDKRAILGKNVKSNQCLAFGPEHEDSISYAPANNIDFDKVINKFSGQDRAILVLYCEWQMDFKEIGKVLGCTESNVCLRMSAMKPNLRKMLKRIGLK